MTEQVRPSFEVREQLVIDCARRFARARDEFNRLRVSKRSGHEIALARTRRDRAIDQLVDAVEELDR